MDTALPSSAIIVAQTAADKPIFAAASREWLKRTHTHPFLTDGTKTLCTALYLYFNVKHYQKTGELIAYPTWGRLMREFGLSQTTIYESLAQLEQCRLIEIERGRYDRAAGKRTRNLYRVPRFPEVGAYRQPSEYEGNQPSENEQYYVDSTSRLGESLDSVRGKKGWPRGPRGPEGKQERKLTEQELKESLERLEPRSRRGRAAITHHQRRTDYACRHQADGHSP